MKKLKKILIWTVSIIGGCYIAGCTLLRFHQETFLFFPDKLPADYKFPYQEPYEEVTVVTKDKTKLNALLFKADTSTPKGVVYFLHGNGGTLASWGSIAPPYLDLGYDVFALDYRGYGKSEGEIFSEEQFFSDAQTAYDTLKQRYTESKIIIVGYSIGTGTASMLASTNHPSRLILQAPYYSIPDVMHSHFPFIPGFIVKYKFKTWYYLERTKVPIDIFHGNQDRTIYYQSSEKLKKHLRPTDHVTIIDGLGHVGVNDSEAYLNWLNETLK